MAYLIWWFSVELLLPGSYNPIGSRLLVVLFCWTTLIASLYFSFVARNIAKWFLFCLCLVTAHYFYLFHRNQADINWVVGSYITVIAACSCLQTESELLGYSACVLLLSGVLSFLNHTLLRTIFLPGILTILSFAYLGLRSRLRLLKTLSEQNFRLQLVNEELETFSSSVSHDLRTPLRAIVGFSEMIVADHGAALDEEVRSHLERIVNGGQRMAELIESLLSMSKIVRGEIRHSEVDLSELCVKIIENLK
ncbi:MAG: sensor histidine kinase, partial [Bdellovibrionota bacterium]